MAIANLNIADFLKEGTNITLTVSSDGRIITIAASGGGGGHTIQDEGGSLTQRTKLNFIGATVTVTDNAGSDSSDVTITDPSQVSDDAYNESTWNGVTTIAPSKNAVRDKVETLAPLASPTFTGTPLAPTPSVGDDSTKIATTEFVVDYLSSLGGDELELAYTMSNFNYTQR